jgi:glycosyltransferase involved in cell wall biosynthesis
MIVKNEEAILARCLDSIADLMDEIIIVDTGSSDRTKEVALRYTDKVFDYTWINDFADARNYSFSKASMDYIYAPDADEMLDETNRQRFRDLKQCLLPEIELVQMKYVTVSEFNTVLNSKKEYRPKLFKRLRSFTWIDPIHETVRLDPVVFDSDIEILHMPTASHGKRDFSIFLKAYQRDGGLSDKVFMMYARELYKTGDLEDFLAAKDIFLNLWEADTASENGKKAACILARLARMENNPTELLKYALRDMLENPCAEICYELGNYYYNQQDFQEAIVWFYNAAYETESIIDIHTSGDLALQGLVDCYQGLIAAAQVNQIENYTALLEQYKDALARWELPEEI